MKKLTLYSLMTTAILLCLVVTGCSDKSKVRWVSTTDSQRWQELSVADSKTDKADSLLTVEITGDTAQIIDGFGACFNELGWDALNMLTQAEKDSILDGFFNPQTGLKFNLCRMPIGANDYARDWYSLNDTPGDYAMEKFNIERDKQNLIPYIKEAMKYKPDLKIWGSPWCPPAWMKTNNHYACRTAEVNDLPEDKQGKEGVNQLTMDDKTLDAYATYFVKYVQAYRAEGINVYAVHVQNEPNSCQNFPSCIWTAGALTTFIGNFLGPKFEKEKLDAEIWYGTIERPYIENIDTVMNDANSSKYVKGVGFQWAGKGAIEMTHKKYPYMRLMETESECGDGSNDWKAAEYTFGLMKHYFTNGANSYMYWNMILDETGKSQWGWKQNSLISVDSKTKKASFNPEYYLIKHFSHFVEVGAYRLETKGNFSDVLAFKNPDGKTVIIITNTAESSKVVNIKLDNNKLNVELPAHSFNTFYL